MRAKLMAGLGAFTAALLAYNLYQIFMVVPDEAQQGMIYRIMYFHVPAAWTAIVALGVAVYAGVMYLITKKFSYDAMAVAAVEVGLCFGLVNMVTGAIWGRIIWGIWWTWDARLTSMFVCWILYAGYLMLRHGIEDPSARARIAAVFSLFAFADVPIVIFSIKWWRTQHPQPVVWGGGSMDKLMFIALMMNFLAVLLLGTMMFLLRLRQENLQREIDAMRRLAHAA